MADYMPLTPAPPQIRVSTWQQFQDFANILKAFIGTGYLSMPFAFYNSGLVLGVVGVTLIATITSHCCQLIVKCKHVAVDTVLKSSPLYEELSNEECHEELAKIQEGIEKEMTLGDIGKVAVGKWGVRIVNTALVVTQTGFCVAYFIFMGNTIKDMFNVSYKTHNIVHINETAQLQAASQDELLQNSSSMVPPIIGNSAAPTFILLVLIPMPLIILMAFIRDVRKLGPISGIANIAILGGFVAFLVYLLHGLHFKLQDVKLTHWQTFPIFFGQITCAYEGIGTIIPIESSMAENRPRFPLYLALALVQYSIFLGSFGLLGYLIYASNTPQIITSILPDAMFSQCIRIALVVAVLFTYPLQIYPVIEIVEDLIFTRVRTTDSGHLSEVMAGPSSETKELSNDQVHNGYQSDHNHGRMGDPRLSRSSPDSTVSGSSKESQVLLQQPVGHGSSSARQYKASTWARNLVRTILVMISAAIAVLLKDEFAYVIALIGSMGSALLAYILPCICHLILFRETNSWLTVIKDSTLILVGVVGAIVGVVITTQNIIMDFQARK